MNWTVTSMDCYVQQDNLSDVVYCVHYQCTDTQTIDGKEYSGRVYSTCSLPAPEGSFTPYDQLTQQQVLDWIWANGVDKDATEAAVEQQIQSQAHPTVISPALPWNAQ
jgi:hypothetical protein